LDFWGKQWQSDLGGNGNWNWKNRPISNSTRITTVRLTPFGWRFGPSSIHSRTSRLIDINGDGLPDRVFARNPSNEQPGFYVFLNTGPGWSSASGLWSNTRSGKPSPLRSISLECSPFL
jgi:hypothetical protein